MLKNCHQHFYVFQNLMSSWGWGNTIFEITLYTWVFKYLVPNLLFFFLAYLGLFWNQGSRSVWLFEMIMWDGMHDYLRWLSEKYHDYLRWLFESWHDYLRYLWDDYLKVHDYLQCCPGSGVWPRRIWGLAPEDLVPGGVDTGQGRGQRY